jgi:hypothetical protein
LTPDEVSTLTNNNYINVHSSDVAWVLLEGQIQWSR